MSWKLTRNASTSTTPSPAAFSSSTPPHHDVKTSSTGSSEPWSSSGAVTRLMCGDVPLSSSHAERRVHHDLTCLCISKAISNRIVEIHDENLDLPRAERLSQPTRTRHAGLRRRRLHRSRRTARHGAMGSRRAARRHVLRHAWRDKHYVVRRTAHHRRSLRAARRVGRRRWRWRCAACGG